MIFLKHMNNSIIKFLKLKKTPEEINLLKENDCKS